MRSGECRLLAQEDDDPAFYIESLVVVVLPFIGGDSITGKGQSGTGLARRRKGKWNIVFMDLQDLLRTQTFNVEAVAGGEFSADDDVKGLQESFGPLRFKSQARVAMRSEEHTSELQSL